MGGRIIPTQGSLLSRLPNWQDPAGREFSRSTRTLIRNTVEFRREGLTVLALRLGSVKQNLKALVLCAQGSRLLALHFAMRTSFVVRGGVGNGNRLWVSGRVWAPGSLNRRELS